MRMLVQRLTLRISRRIVCVGDGGRDASIADRAIVSLRKGRSPTEPRIAPRSACIPHICAYTVNKKAGPRRGEARDRRWEGRRESCRTTLSSSFARQGQSSMVSMTVQYSKGLGVDQHHFWARLRLGREGGLWDVRDVKVRAKTTSRTSGSTRPWQFENRHRRTLPSPRLQADGT